MSSGLEPAREDPLAQNLLNSQAIARSELTRAPKKMLDKMLSDPTKVTELTHEGDSLGFFVPSEIFRDDGMAVWEEYEE